MCVRTYLDGEGGGCCAGGVDCFHVLRGTNGRREIRSKWKRGGIDCVLLHTRWWGMETSRATVVGEN